MMHIRNCPLVLSCVAMMSFRSASEAALSPRTTGDMKQSADELAMISVTKVSPLVMTDSPQQQECPTHYDITAEVAHTSRSTIGFQEGDTINFQSYYYDPTSSACQSFTGPSSPPELTEGWCGYAYLNDGDADTTSQFLTLAAFGDSLEPESQDKCAKELDGVSYCTFAPDNTCYTDGWPSCCSSDAENCPQTKPACDIPASGNSYCTYAPDKTCYASGWPSCCSGDTNSCPATKPPCDVPLYGASYCTYAPDNICYISGWPACCSNDGLECPQTKPACDHTRKLRGFLSM